jgi:Zn-dependent protease/CBS domain-containing protein
MGSGWRIGRVLGIDISIHPSWLVIAALLTFSMAEGSIKDLFPGWSPGLYWLAGAAAAILFFASVVAHELSHAILARRFGMEVRGITLFIFGGATELEGDARRPRDEALMAAAGPATSLVIGAGLLGIAFVLPGPLNGLIWSLGFINVALGIFNLVTGFPLDGGRILRAVILRLRGERIAATGIAAMVGRLIAYGLIIFGIIMTLQGGLGGGGLWLALIGWFLSNAAEATAVQARIEGSLRGMRVRDIMDSAAPVVSPNESVASFVDNRLLRGDRRSFLVAYDDDGGLAGMVTLADIRRVPRERWEETRVTDVMTRFNDLATIGPDEAATDALGVLQAREIGQLPVVVDGRTPVGLLTLGGILRLIDTRKRLGV